MGLLLAGCFVTGSELGKEDELPLHEVCLSPFWIGRTEITNDGYANCVDSGPCSLPHETTYCDDQLTEEKIQTKYDTIQTNIQVMVDMLDYILTLGKAESGKLTFNPAPLNIITFCQRVATETSQAVDASSRIEFSSQGTATTPFWMPTCCDIFWAICCRMRSNILQRIAR